MNPLRGLLVLSCLSAGCGPQLLGELDVEQAQQALTVYTLEAEQLQGNGSTRVVFDSTASAGAALLLAPFGAASQTIWPPVSGTSLVFRAWRTGCTVAAPLQVKLGATVVGTLDVSASSWATLALPASVPTGPLTLTVTHQNASTCRLYVDTVVVDGPVAPPVATVYQAEDPAFTGGGAALGTYRRFLTNGTASRTITTTAPATQLGVRASSLRCTIDTPRVVVAFDGVTVIDSVITSGGAWYTPSAALASLPAGTHTISIAYPNDSDAPPCDSRLDVDWVQVTTQP